MAKYTLTRTLGSGELLKVEQANAWDEAYKLLDKGEAEINRMKEEDARLAKEEGSNKVEKPEVEAPAEDTPTESFGSSISYTDTTEEHTSASESNESEIKD